MVPWTMASGELGVAIDGKWIGAGWSWPFGEVG